MKLLLVAGVAEQTLYRRLIAALPDHVVLAQVQLLQAVRFARGAWKPGILNRISLVWSTRDMPDVRAIGLAIAAVSGVH